MWAPSTGQSSVGSSETTDYPTQNKILGSNSENDSNQHKDTSERYESAVKRPIVGGIRPVIWLLCSNKIPRHFITLLKYRINRCMTHFSTLNDWLDVIQFFIQFCSTKHTQTWCKNLNTFSRNVFHESNENEICIFDVCLWFLSNSFWRGARMKLEIGDVSTIFIRNVRTDSSRCWKIILWVF